MVEQRTHNPLVMGSFPIRTTIFTKNKMTKTIQIYILAYDASGIGTSVHWFYTLKEVRLWLAEEVIEKDNEDYETALDFLENKNADRFFVFFKVTLIREISVGTVKSRKLKLTRR